MNWVGSAWAKLRDRSTRGGASQSGLTAMGDLNLVSAAGDVMVTVALASTLFFSVPIGQARGRVALYLLVTMAPFALVAPVVGPLLDRFGRARRASLVVTLIARLLLAQALATRANGVELYPLALGTLVASKASGVARSAIMPRVAPQGRTLVEVNSRLQLYSTAGSTLGAPIAAAMSHEFGFDWLLRASVVVYATAILLAIRLPRHVDDPAPSSEHFAAGLTTAVIVGAHSRRSRLLGDVPHELRRVLPLRALVGFLTLFLAFYVRTDGRHHSNAALGALAVAVAIGNTGGLLLGGKIGRRRPEGIIGVSQVLAVASCVAAAIFFSFNGALLLALVASLAAVTAKLGLDTIIQRDVPATVRASAFGRSETFMQLGWVVGGALGLIPFTGREGFVMAAVVTSAALLTSVRRHPHRAALPLDPLGAIPAAARAPR